jgi:hypothetical protein
MIFQIRPDFVRMASVAAVAASCLAAAACGSSGSSSTSAAASPSSTKNPLASLTGTQVLRDAVTNAENAPSLTMNGTVAQPSQTYTIDLGIKHGQGCAGTIGVGAEGSLKLIVIGQTVYLNPDKQFWTVNAGSDASAVIGLINGRYVKTTTSDKNVAGLNNLCNVSQILNSGSSGTVTATKGAITTLNGTRVQALKTSDGTTVYVTDTSKPQLVEAVAPKSAKNGSGRIAVMVGAPVTLIAPSASRVLNGSEIDF